MELETEKVGLKLASALLLHRGELSVKDIQSMPFFKNPDQIKHIVEFLIQTFNARIYTEQVATYPFPEWEQYIRIGTYPKIRRPRTKHQV